MPEVGGLGASIGAKEIKRSTPLQPLKGQIAPCCSTTSENP